MMRATSRDEKRQDIIFTRKQLTMEGKRVQQFTTPEHRGAYPMLKQHCSTEKYRTNLMGVRQLHKAQSIKLPLLKQVYPETSVVRLKNKDWGLSEDEKQQYGDRTPNNYMKLELLGKGGFALVWLCQDVARNTQIAVKQILRSNNSAYTREQRFYQHFFQNEDKMYDLGYQNLVEIKGWESSQRDIWILQELGGKTLSKAMYTLKGEFYKGERVYSITETDLTLNLQRQPHLFILLLKEILQGISFIHKEGFTHCDLKPENILIDFNFEKEEFNSIKIIDYGSAFTFDDSENIGMVTPEYMAPEVLDIIHNWSKYNSVFKTQTTALKSICSESNVDIWSYGAIILDLLVGIPHWLSYKGKIMRNGRAQLKFGLFANKGRELDKIMVKQGQIIQNLEQIVKENATYLSMKSRTLLVDLLQQILKIKPSERATPAEVLNHQFFQSF